MNKRILVFICSLIQVFSVSICEPPPKRPYHAENLFIYLLSFGLLLHIKKTKNNEKKPKWPGEPITAAPL